MADQVLLIEGVSKSIQKQSIVNQVSLSLNKGDVYALCGGNGAGKSTLLRMVMGILQPTAGRIEVNGISWKEDRRSYAEQIGYMPDDYSFAKGLTAWESLHFWASLRGLPRSRTEEVLVEVGLAQVKSKQVSSFSKGMRQRLLFAQALLSKPSLLVLDEPTNGLDPYWMDAFVGLVNRASQDGHAVLYSTHQLPVAEATADQVMFLQEGSAIKQGPVSAFMEEYGPGGLHAAFSDTRPAP